MRRHQKHISLRLVLFSFSFVLKVRLLAGMSMTTVNFNGVQGLATPFCDLVSETPV